MAPLPSGVYNISNGKEKNSYVTFPDKAGDDIKMSPTGSDKRQKVRVTKDERGYEIEVDGADMLPPIGAFLPNNKMQADTNLQASLEHRTLFVVDEVKGKNAHTIHMLSGSVANLYWESNGTDPIWVQPPGTAPTPEQTWIFTLAK